MTFGIGNLSFSDLAEGDTVESEPTQWFGKQGSITVKLETGMPSLTDEGIVVADVQLVANKQQNILEI